MRCHVRADRIPQNSRGYHSTEHQDECKSCSESIPPEGELLCKRCRKRTTPGGKLSIWQGTRLNGRPFLWSYVSLWDEEDISMKRKVKGVPEFATVFLASP